MFKKYFLFIFILVLLAVLPGCQLVPTPGGGGGGRSIATKGIYKSEDKGVSWVEKNSIKGSTEKISRLNIYKMNFDILDSRIIYMATNNGLYASENSGDEWYKMFPGDIKDFALNPKTRGIIYVTTGNDLRKTTDNGINWEVIYTETRPGHVINSIVISQFDTSRVYILTNKGALMMSNDWGSSWKLRYDFKKEVSELLINPNNSQKLYVAIKEGLYKSSNEGVDWTEILAGQNKYFVGIKSYKDLQFTNVDNELFYLSKYGILKSRDNGNSWKAIDLITSPGTVDIRAFGFNPKDNDEIYYTVDNVLYSTLDAGRNWKTTVVPVKGGAKVNQLLVDFYDPNNLYIGLIQ